MIRTPLKFNDGRVSLSSDHEGKSAATDWELIASSVSSFSHHTNHSFAHLELTTSTGLLCHC